MTAGSHRERIRRLLAGSVPAADPVAAALASLPPGQAASLYPEPLIPAAVLVPLVERPAGLSLVLTRRSDQLRDHPGQVSFPGGRLEPGDQGPVATAVRETMEEIGVDARHIDVVGFLPPHAVITGFVVNPVVGFLDPSARFHPDSFEVAEVFEVPLAFFRDPATVEVGLREVRGLSLTVHTWHYEGRQIWGATAQMIRSLCETLNESEG